MIRIESKKLCFAITGTQLFANNTIGNSKIANCRKMSKTNHENQHDGVILVRKAY